MIADFGSQVETREEMVKNTSKVCTKCKLWCTAKILLTTLCESAVFAVGRCLSVCPSVCTSVWHVRIFYPDGSNFFLGPVATSFNLFYPSHRHPILAGSCSAWALNTQGWENFVIFFST